VTRVNTTKQPLLGAHVGGTTADFVAPSRTVPPSRVGLVVVVVVVVVFAVVVVVVFGFVVVVVVVFGFVVVVVVDFDFEPVAASTAAGAAPANRAIATIKTRFIR
jgi:hypothetical protein